VDECKQAISQIQKERKEGICQRDVMAYLAAFGENSLLSYVYNHEGLRRDSERFQVSKEKLTECIIRQLEEFDLLSF